MARPPGSLNEARVFAKGAQGPLEVIDGTLPKGGWNPSAVAGGSRLDWWQDPACCGPLHSLSNLEGKLGEQGLVSCKSSCPVWQKSSVVVQVSV